MNMLIVLGVIILQLYPVSGILCPETGLKFVGNPTNCETFFVCNNGIATLLECSVGMQFDKSTGFCSRAEDVKCVAVELPIPLEIPSVPEIESEEEPETELQTEHENEHGLESETEINDDFKQECPENGLKFFPNPQSCTSFIKCINGKEYFLECPVGLHFDETTAFCDRPENVNCIESGPVPDVESETEAEAKPETDPEIKPEPEAETQPEIEPEAEPEIEPETESETEPEIESETKPEIELETEPETEHEVEPETETEDALKVECPENGLQFLPNPKSCTSFIKCLNGAVFLLECPTGLQFDETTGFCDRPENVNCLAGELPEPDEETQDISVECPEEGHNFLPHPVDCEKFIECKFGVQLIQNCASGLHWNAANGFCDFVENANCDIPGTEIELEPDIEPETEVEVKPEIGPETEPETYPEIEPETELETEPEEEPEIEHEVELETDPETELEIESGTEPEIELELEPETEPETESETKPEIDPETEHEIETETETEDGFKVYCPENGFKFFSNPQSCTSFAKCLNGVAYFLECPAGQYFDDTTGFCDRPENVNCAAEGLPEPDDEKPNISMECPEEGHYFLPHPADCEKFIECKFGFQVIHNCAPGFHWDSTNGFCNFAENVKCQIPEDEIEPGPAPDVESETEVVEKPETESGTEAETEPDTEPETETGPEPEIEPETELETKPETEPETETETETEFEPEPEPEFETEPETELESESETEPETELVTESETEYEIESETESGDELEPEPESENHKPGPIGKCPPLDGATGTFLADGADCNVFYICVWGEPARKECNSGLHFNPEMMICDWPSQAGCKSTNY